MRYVGKYQTTRSKLCTYLARKIGERGWEGPIEPNLEAIADHFSELGYIDDAAFALSKSRSLGGRGYGRRRVAEQLRSAGVNEDDGREALDAAEVDAISAALRFARKRRIGPFAVDAHDRKNREKAVAAMVRAGHDPGLARTIANLNPAEDADLVNLSESLRLDSA